MLVEQRQIFDDHVLELDGNGYEVTFRGLDGSHDALWCYNQLYTDSGGGNDNPRSAGWRKMWRFQREEVSDLGGVRKVSRVERV